MFHDDQAPTHVQHLRQFLKWLIVLAWGFATAAAVAAYLFRMLELWLGSGVLVGYGCILLGAWWLVQRGRWQRAVAIICIGMLAAALCAVVLQPTWAAAVAIVPLIAVAAALPYVRSKPLRTLMLTAMGVTVGVIVIGTVKDAPVVWRNVDQVVFARVFQSTSLGAAIATVFLLLWQFSSRLNEALARSQAAEARYGVAVRGANDGIWDWDLQARTIYYSPRWKEMLGLRDDEVGSTIGEWYDRVHPDDRALLQGAISAHIEGDKQKLEHEYRMRCHDGGYRWMLCRGLAVRDADGAAIRLAGSQTDVTERKRAEEQLRHDSLHDSLTSLPNRTLFTDRLTQLLERAKRHADLPFAVVFLDLDRFKIINDSLGHMVGDMLLTKIAQRLAKGMRQGDTVARLGGDEFAVLLAELPTTNMAMEIAERIQQLVSEPFKLGSHDVFTTASIGIAMSTSGYTSADDMVRDADIAMYRAKWLGKARTVVFDQEMHAHVMRRLETENELRRALERDELDVFYQPLVSLQHGRICGFEALLRWNHPERGLVLPSEFLDIAEETGLLVPIGRWLLRRACAHIVAWQERYPHSAPLGINVNLSGTQVLDPNLVTDVAQVLHETGLNPNQLVLEITEGVILDHDDGVVAATLRSLRELQVHLHLDDFGTGYASLISLHNLPVSAVKIDRTFVSTMDAAPENNAIVRAIVALSHNLGLDVIAEGVETAVHFAALRALGCPYAQGNYFSNPLDAAHAEATLAAHQHWQCDDYYVTKVALPTIPHQKAFPSTAA